MAKENEATPAEPNPEPTKEELQRRMEKTRANLAHSVEEIKEVVERQYDSVKETVTGVLDYREHFKKEPLVWSLGALSAGFALGYTLGYAHKNIKGSRSKHSEVAAFAESITRDLSTVGQSLVMPALNVQIKELFGFGFSELLEEIGGTKRSRSKRSRSKQSAGKRSIKRKGTKKNAGKSRKSRNAVS